MDNLTLIKLAQGTKQNTDSWGIGKAWGKVTDMAKKIPTQKDINMYSKVTQLKKDYPDMYKQISHIISTGKPEDWKRLSSNMKSIGKNVGYDFGGKPLDWKGIHSATGKAKQYSGYYGAASNIWNKLKPFWSKITGGFGGLMKGIGGSRGPVSYY